MMKEKYRESLVSTMTGKAHDKEDKLDLSCSYFDIQGSSTKVIVAGTEGMTGQDRRCQLGGRTIDM